MGLGDTARGLAQRSLHSLLAALPEPVLRTLAGGGRVAVDGQDLEPDVRLMLRLLSLSGQREVSTMAVDEAREATRQAAAAWTLGDATSVVEPLEFPGPAGPLRARLYLPRGRRAGLPLVVFFHGGGWVVGDLDTHDGACRLLAEQAGAGVLSIDYRLAPEHRFPAAVEDAIASFRWAAANAARLGFDTSRVAVAGDSAGGNLAATVAIAAARDGGPAPVAQLLLYPVADLSRKHPSYRLFAEGFFLTEADMDWYKAHYLRSAGDASEPAASPLLAPDVSGVAPAVVATAGFDPLRDEAEAYARRLESSGVRVRLRRFPGQVHGFVHAAAVLPSARAAVLEVTRLFGEEIAAAGAPRREHGGRPDRGQGRTGVVAGAAGSDDCGR